MGDNKVLVTGATGFIGSAVFKRLKSIGCGVDGLSLRGGEVDGEHISSVDIASERALFGYAKGKSYKAIFHIAACIPQTFDSAESEECFYPNIMSIQNILKLSSGMRNCHMIYASSVAVYGESRSFPLAESSSCRPDNYYALSKYVAELLAGLYRKSLPITILRISSPYGPGSIRRTVINIFCRRALLSDDLKLYGTGGRSQDFVYIDDIVEAFMLSFKSRHTGIFNVCAGGSISMRDLAGLVVSLTPASASRIVLSGLPDPQEDFRAIYSNANALKVLGFMPCVSIEEGLRRTISWWQRQL